MLETANDGELWKSRIFFPNSDKVGEKRVDEIRALLKKVTNKIVGWDKDKMTGLFRKTATGKALGAGADANAVNRHMGWKPDTQSRSYAGADLGAHLHEQAVLAGFDNKTWRQNHHLGRSAIPVGVSWCDALFPGLGKLSAILDLSPRRQEVLQCIQKLAQAYWQALPINTLKYGTNFVQGLPNVLKVMQLPEYALFSDKVRQAECDSMEKLHMMQDVPYLAAWNTNKAKHAREELQQVAHHEGTLSTIFSETRKQSHVRCAEAAGINNAEPVAKRQRLETQTSEQDPEEQALQAELAQLDAQLEALLRKKALQAQIDVKKKALLELNQDAEKLKRGQHAAQQGTFATQASLAVPAFSYGVQPINSLYDTDSAHQTVPCSSAAECCTVPRPQSQEVTKAPKHPDFFQSKTIAGRYQEWIGDGQYAGIKSQLVMTRRGLALPKTKGESHAGGARSNLQKKKHLPVAIEKLVVLW